MRTVKAQDEYRADQLIFQPSQDSVPLSPSLRNNTAEDICAFLGKGVHFKGTISYQGTIQIDGLFDGEIQTDGVVLVGEGAELKANVTAGTVVSKGTITGDIWAKEKLILQAPSVIVGDVTTPTFSIEEGALVDGNLKMGQDAHEVEREPALRAVPSSEQFAGKRMAV